MHAQWEYPALLCVFFFFILTRRGSALQVVVQFWSYQFNVSLAVHETKLELGDFYVKKCASYKNQCGHKRQIS
jgi:hypothetical protein